MTGDYDDYNYTVSQKTSHPIDDSTFSKTQPIFKFLSPLEKEINSPYNRAIFPIMPYARCQKKLKSVANLVENAIENALIFTHNAVTCVIY